MSEKKRLEEHLEVLMRESRVLGYRSGVMDCVQAVLSARGVPLSFEAALMLGTCKDLEKLKSWAGRAATVGRAADLFAEYYEAEE